MNPDFSDMLSALSDEGVEFLVVGAYALAAHGLPRATGDLDVWVRPAVANAEHVLQALIRFGAPTDAIAVEDFRVGGIVFQIGVAPSRIDLLTAIDGVDFEDAWRERVEVDVEGVRVPVISREHLLRNKQATGRPRDRADADWLESTEHG